MKILYKEAIGRLKYLEKQYKKNKDEETKTRINELNLTIVRIQQLLLSELDNKEKKHYYVIRRKNCGTSADKSDLIGLTTNKKLAKEKQSLFCSFEEIKIIK